MDIRPAKRVNALRGYAFAQLQARVAELRAAGHEVLDFGVGDPTVSTPETVRKACKAAVERRATAGYPRYSGNDEFRHAVVSWLQRRFGVKLDEDAEITSTIGSKEAVAHFPQGIVDPGDIVLCPSPGYPPYVRGTLLAGGTPYHVPVWDQSDMLPDLARVPDEIVARTRLLWFCHPHAPTGRCATLEELQRIYFWAAERGIPVASDEAYIDFYFDRPPPPSMLEVARDGVIVFFSLSKRSAMTGYRVGFACGDPRLIDLLRAVKTNVDSGTPWFVEDAATAALNDEEHVLAMRNMYAQNREALCQGLAAAGFQPCRPQGTIYIWQRVPAGITSLDFALRLLEPPMPIVVTPGPWISETLDDGQYPGAGYVRFALVPPPNQVKKAGERLATLTL